MFKAELLPHGYSQKMESFIRKNASPADAIGDMMTRKIELKVGKLKVPLFLIEDNQGAWPQGSCKHCRVAGCELVSTERFHMVIPIEEEWDGPLDATVLEFPEQHCLLYSLVHSIAFAHLLWVQRSSAMSGSDLMDIWDTLSKYLEIRGVTLEDVGKRGGAELPVLHGLAYGNSWFSRWGYTYWKGTYGVDRLRFDLALAYLRDLPVFQAASLLEDGSIVLPILEQYNALYFEEITTLGELLHFMLTYPEVAKSSAEARLSSQIPLKKWKRAEITEVLLVLLHVLDRSSRNPVTKEALMLAAGSPARPTQLVEHVVSNLKNLKYGDFRMIICRENAVAKVLEYSLEYIPISTTQELDVHHDAIVVYREIVQKYPETDERYSMLKMAERTILRYKYLIRGTQPQSSERSDKGTVHCKCGAGNDDGEALVQCGVCNVFEHLECIEFGNTGSGRMCDSCFTAKVEKKLAAALEEKSKAAISEVEEDLLKQI